MSNSTVDRREFQTNFGNSLSKVCETHFNTTGEQWTVTSKHLAKCWNKDIKIVNNKIVIKLLFRNLFQLFVEVIVFSESA